MGLYQSEMNTLVITYNVEDVNIIDYDPVLYLVKDITKNKFYFLQGISLVNPLWLNWFMQILEG